ncbi:MAG: SAM-dependent methyltransferase [Clostridia bacterium]|nr:SAM-dependent methyltransferase [Clostridia bacterium]
MSNEFSSLLSLIELATQKSRLRKAVLSKPLDPSLIRSVLTPKQVKGQTVWQIEHFHKDNKATHVNIPLSEPDRLLALLQDYQQINVLTTAGDCECKCSKSGKVTLLGAGKLQNALAQDDGAETVEPGGNDKQKNYILTGREPFLIHLGVSAPDGRVHDKMQSKFRQINRFLELIRDVESHLDGCSPLKIADLCCGKSYLSFAVFHYFSVIRQRDVQMVGVDLKQDVIEFCEQTARALHFDGLRFFCEDVFRFDPDFKPDMVLSLHACDTATDAVLEKAVLWNTPVILSTPCCQHELNHKLNCPEMDFIAKYSMLRQKFCEAATDSLRLLRLEAAGYSVAALELIDPEETPKNILLRGIKDPNFRANSPAALQKLAEYNRVRQFLMQER